MLRCEKKVFNAASAVTCPKNKKGIRVKHATALPLNTPQRGRRLWYLVAGRIIIVTEFWSGAFLTR
jgi:hypothetical protein